VVVENMKTSTTNEIPIILRKYEVEADASERTEFTLLTKNDIHFIDKLHTH
jgi:hypothetical protein